MIDHPCTSTVAELRSEFSCCLHDTTLNEESYGIQSVLALRIP